MPAVIPVNIPEVLPTVATPAVPLLQLPIASGELSKDVLPMQTAIAPRMLDGLAFTV